MKFSLQNPEVLRLPGRDKRPGRKLNLFHRVIMFHPLKLLPIVKNGEIRIIASKGNRNSPVFSCNISTWQPRKAERLHNSRAWQQAHGLGEGKAQELHQSASRVKNAQGCAPEAWEMGWRAPSAISWPQVLLVWTLARSCTLGEQLGVTYLLAMFRWLALLRSLCQRCDWRRLFAAGSPGYHREDRSLPAEHSGEGEADERAALLLKNICW